MWNFDILWKSLAGLSCIAVPGARSQVSPSILSPGCFTLPCISYEILVLDQFNYYLMSWSILITRLLDNVWIL